MPPPKGGSSSAENAPPKTDRQTRQTLPNWRKDPEEYGVALLHADSQKAMEVADAIFTAFFMITGATENPVETANQMSSGVPSILNTLYEMRNRIAELEAENAGLNAALRDQTRSEAGARGRGDLTFTAV